MLDRMNVRGGCIQERNRVMNGPSRTERKAMISNTGSGKWTINDEVRFLDRMAKDYPCQYGKQLRGTILPSKGEFFRQYLAGLSLRHSGFNGGLLSKKDRFKIKSRIATILINLGETAVVK